MDDIFDDPTYSDFCIVSENGKLHVHKCILAKNLYFKTLFETKIGEPPRDDIVSYSGKLSPRKQNLLRVDNIHAVRFLVYYIYTNRLDAKHLSKWEDLIDSLEMADMWQMNIKNVLYQFVRKNLASIARETTLYCPYIWAYFKDIDQSNDFQRLLMVYLKKIPDPQLRMEHVPKKWRSKLVNLY
jgi:hypothetical protein